MPALSLNHPVTLVAPLKKCNGSTYKKMLVFQNSHLYRLPNKHVL